MRHAETLYPASMIIGLSQHDHQMLSAERPIDRSGTADKVELALPKNHARQPISTATSAEESMVKGLSWGPHFPQHPFCCSITLQSASQLNS